MGLLLSVCILALCRGDKVFSHFLRGGVLRRVLRSWRMMFPILPLSDFFFSFQLCFSPSLPFTLTLFSYISPVSVSAMATQVNLPPDRGAEGQGRRGREGRIPVRVEFIENSLTYMDRLLLKKHRRYTERQCTCTMYTYRILKHVEASATEFRQQAISSLYLTTYLFSSTSGCSLFTLVNRGNSQLYSNIIICLYSSYV